jgi:hypothetical protein
MVSVDFDGAGFTRRWAAAVNEPPLEGRILRSVLICGVFFYSVTANAYGRKKGCQLGREHVSEALVNTTHCRFLRHRPKLFELQEWLGYRLPSSTQRYAKITPTKLVKSYSDAGYFRRNLRAIEVLIDQEKVRSGLGANEPRKFYDLGQHAASPIMPN